MRKFIAIVCALTGLAIAQNANADKFRVGLTGDLGFPSGGGIGVTVHPFENWATLEGSIDYNAMSAGARVGVQLDPLALCHEFPIGIFGDFQYGYFDRGNIPGQSNWPQVGYQYGDFFGGLRLGKAHTFHWNFEFGETYAYVTTNNFQSILPINTGVSVGNPTAKVWAPAFQTGFQLFFW